MKCYFLFSIFVKKRDMGILRLKDLMALKGMSREELATSAGVSVTTISNINSEKNLPTINLLLEIAKTLDVDIREMFVPTKGNFVIQNDIDEVKDLLKKSLQILEAEK